MTQKRATRMGNGSPTDPLNGSVAVVNKEDSHGRAVVRFSVTQTYDEKQMGAVLMVCGLCQLAFWMTKPAPVCIACRRKHV